MVGQRKQRLVMGMQTLFIITTLSHARDLPQGRGSADDRAGAMAYLAIQDDLEDYANAHPAIRSIIDPIYLVGG